MASLILYRNNICLSLQLRLCIWYSFWVCLTRRALCTITKEDWNVLFFLFYIFRNLLKFILPETFLFFHITKLCGKKGGHFVICICYLLIHKLLFSERMFKNGNNIYKQKKGKINDMCSQMAMNCTARYPRKGFEITTLWVVNIKEKFSETHTLVRKINVHKCDAKVMAFRQRKLYLKLFSE